MKLKIDNESLAEEFFENSFLMGIVSPVKDYLFTWHVNKKLGLNFRLNNSLEIQLRKKNRNYFFAVYEFLEPGCNTAHLLYNNQHDGEYLLPEFKHLDFLWLIRGDEIDKIAANSLLQSIKLIPSVQLVNEMTNEKIKHKQHLIL
ncbi:MAG: IPExxxVDY family protein [Gloeobacteraceae cyanobacterium ES-bin-316]|nr:IPExxxVDY family protein [Ferruginibacter sp.]